MGREIRMDNRLSNFGLRNLSTLEQNLWWSISRLIKDRGTQKLVFTRKEIDEISGYNERNLRSLDFVKSMREMGQKIVSINTELYDNTKRRWIIFSLFPVFEVSEEEVVLQVSEYFEPWFNDIQKSFTRIDLSILVSLRSGYAKELYRFLMRWKDLKRNSNLPGYWAVDIKEFRRLMCIPEKYNMKDIRKIVLEPAIKELTTKNDNGWSPLDVLNVEYIIRPGNKKKVESLIFSFKQSQTDKEKIEEVNSDNNLLSIVPPVPLNNVYTDNFENGYIPGQNSPTNGFKSWLNYIGLFKVNDEYFDMRSTAKKTLISIYKEKVIDNKSKAWTDMRFFAAVYSVIINDKAMTSWNIEDAYAEIRKGKRIDIPKEVYSSLPEDKGNQLQAFALKGEIV